MDNIVVLLFRALLSVIAIYFIAKMFAPLFSDFIDKIIGRPKKNDVHSFDELVNAKMKQINMQHTTLSINTEENNNKVITAHKNKTIDSYLKHNDQKVVKLFDHLDWGESKEHLIIANGLNDSYHRNFETNQISNALNKIIKEDLLLLLNRTAFASYDEIITLIANVATLQALIFEIQKGRGKTISLLAKINCHSDEQNFIKATLSELLLLQKIKPILVYKHLLEDKLIADDPFMTIPSTDILSKATALLFSTDHKVITTQQQLIATLTKKIDIFLALTKVPEPKTVSIKELYQIFGATTETDPKILKSRFNKLAKAIHPDALAAMDIPEEIKVMANTNFSNLRAAYQKITGEM